MGVGALKILKWQAFHGSFAKRLAIRTLMFAIVIAITMLPLMQLVCYVDPSEPRFLGSNGCDTDLGFPSPDSLLGRVLNPIASIAFPHLSGMCKENMNLTMDVVIELMGKNLLDYEEKALCIGQGSAEALFVLHEMGFSYVDVVHRHPFFSLKQKQVICELHYDDNSFGFVITRDLNKVSVPALLVNELERILKPGGVAAILVGIDGSSHESLIRSATSVSSFLKSSNVVHVVSVSTFTLVAFKKRTNGSPSFEDYRLPMNCPSIKRNKPFTDIMEPFAEKKPEGSGERITYVPKLVDLPSGGKLVYVDMAAKQIANISSNNWFLPSYPIDSRAFIIYIVDHDALVLSSHVKSPGVTFIYHPALSGSIGKHKVNTTAHEEPILGEEEFDFFVWFKEIAELADFVVLKMNVGKPEMMFLSELFESGVICHVNELFLNCPESDHTDGSCINVVRSLRKVGVFAHQWWGN